MRYSIPLLPTDCVSHWTPLSCSRSHFVELLRSDSALLATAAVVERPAELAANCTLDSSSVAWNSGVNRMRCLTTRMMMRLKQMPMI